MRFDYGLDQRLPLLKAIVLGLQWAVIAAAMAIILGQVAGSLHFDDPREQITYLQKLLFLTGAAALVQVLWGHRLPVLSGPATIALLAVIANRGSSLDAIYTSVMAGGLALTLFALSGLLGYLRDLFTARVVAVVLLLIAFTLLPTILRLITDDQGGANPLASITFALVLIAVMFVLHQVLGGIWKSTLMIWAMIFGSLLYFLLFPQPAAGAPLGERPLLHGFFTELTTRPVIEPGVLISFLLCYLALAMNDVGAIQSMDPLLKPANMARRIRRGMTFTGLSNMLAGFLGVIGVVNFSLSPGVVVSSACASQYALIPAALILLALSFSPWVMDLLTSVPSVVSGCVLLYLMVSQCASGLVLAFQSGDEGPFTYDDALAIGLPVLLGTVFAFLPAAIVDTFPVILRPILGNGFVVGVTCAFLLEHLVYRRWSRQRKGGLRA